MAKCQPTTTVLVVLVVVVVDAAWFKELTQVLLL